MELAEYLFGMFLGYYVLSKWLRHLVNTGILWLYHRWHTPTLGIDSSPPKEVTPTPTMVKDFNPPKTEDRPLVKGIVVDPQEFDRWLRQNPDLKVENK